MENSEIEKGESYILIEIIEYIPNSIVIKTIIKKTTGNVSLISFDSGEALTENIPSFDTFIQVIDGIAKIIIDEELHILETGQSIIIPAYSQNTIKAHVRFKIISTIIKNSYEDISL